MGVDQTSLDRIRNATFPSSRRGYDKHEVEKFLARLADWLETGGGDESRSDTVKRELKRVGERTGAILAQAEESAQQIRTEAEEEAAEARAAALKEAGETRAAADGYAEKTRAEANTYAEETRRSADQDASETQAQAQQEARETIESAEAQARRIIDEGTQRRDDIEAVIADLVLRRNEVIADSEELMRKLEAAVGEHRADDGDPFDRPDEYDPDERPDLEAEAEVEAGEDDDTAVTEQKPVDETGRSGSKVQA